MLTPGVAPEVMYEARDSIVNPAAMTWLAHLFVKHPELAVYLAIGIGYWLGSFTVKGFSLGGVTGSLLAGLVVGYLFHVPVSGAAKSIVFLLFLFAIGYSVGPKFFKAMKGEGWRYGVLGGVVPMFAIITSYCVARILHLDPGFAGGLVSGALTESPALGSASEAINALNLADDVKLKLVGHLAVADALCYLFGAFGVIWVCTALGPRLLRIDVRAEAEKTEAAYGIKRNKVGVASAWQPFDVRAFRIDAGARATGRTIAEAEQLMPQSRLFVRRIRRDGELLPASADTVLRQGDIVAISGRREILVEVLGAKAEEVPDPELLDIPVASCEVFISDCKWAGRTVGEIAGEDAVRGVFLRKVTRGGQEMPIGTRTTIERGDVLEIVGSEEAVDRAATMLGRRIRPSDSTDFVTVGLAILIGSLVGIVIAVPVGGIKIAVGSSVGTLLAGVVVGYVRSVRPIFGRVPDGAVSFGLSAFVAMIGIGAGPEFITAIREAGWGLLVGGMFVTLVPQIAGLYFGRYVLKANPLLLLGALSGAQTFTAALAALQEKSGSSIAVLGYSGAVPVAHVLLTTWGSVIVILMSR